MIGTWKGLYKYDDKNIPKITGFEFTYFTIQITEFDGRSFNGIVTDDAETGGMHGTGTIDGNVDLSNIYFEKRMEIRYTINTITKTRKISNAAHPIIVYKGELNVDQTAGRGTWKIRSKIRLLWGFIPVRLGGTGTWQMTKVN